MVRIFIVVVIILSLLLAVGMKIDDDLDPEVSKFVSSLDSQSDENAGYFYLMGISAPADKSPSVVGRQHYEKISDLTQSEQFNNIIELEGEVLALSESELFCNVLSKGCFEKIFYTKENLQTLVDEHIVLRERWKRYIDINDFETITSPSMFEVFPRYQYVTRANRVLVIESINDLRENKLAPAQDRIVTNIRHLRRQLVLQDNLIGKLTIAQLLSEQLNVLFLIARQNKRSQPPKIELLTNSEKSLRKIIIRELAMFLETFRGVGNHPELWREEKSLPAWLGKYIFKPNMSINGVFPIYRRAAEYADLSPIAFEKAMSTGSYVEPKGSLVRNFIGTELMQFATSNFDGYIGELNDLNAKIQLFNALVDQEITEEILQGVKSPYYEENRPATFSKNGERVCVEGPLRDDKNMRCLKVKILAAEPN